MHRLPQALAGGFHDGLGIGGVRVHGVEDLFLGRFELLGHHQLGDQLGRLRADQVGAQQLAVLGVEDELDEALGLVRRQGAAAELERELADADLVAGFAWRPSRSARRWRRPGRCRCSRGCSCSRPSGRRSRRAARCSRPPRDGRRGPARAGRSRRRRRRSPARWWRSRSWGRP